MPLPSSLPTVLPEAGGSSTPTITNPVGLTDSITQSFSGGGGGGVTPSGGFNAVRWPRLVVKANLGVGGSMIDIGTDSTGKRAILGFSRGFGRNTPIDSADPGTATLVFNNRSGDYDSAMAGADYPLTVGSRVAVSMEWPAGTLWPRFTGTVTDLTLDVDTGPVPTVTVNAADGLENLGRAQLAAGTTTFPTWYTGERIYDLADLAGWAGGRAIDTGATRLWFNQELGATALELMRLVELTEMGLLFVSEGGVLTFWDRYHPGSATRSTNSQITLTDTGAAGTVKAAGLSRVRSRDGVYNDIRLTRDADPLQDPELVGRHLSRFYVFTGVGGVGTEPGDEPAEQVASDATSIAANGYLNLPADLGKLHQSDAAVLDQANMLLAAYKDIQDRIGSVSINLLHPKVANENLWATILALTLLDRITVFRDYGPANVSHTLLIQRVEEEITPSPPGWTLTLTTANTPPTIPRFIPGTSVPGTDPVGY